MPAEPVLVFRLHVAPGRADGFVRLLRVLSLFRILPWLRAQVRARRSASPPLYVRPSTASCAKFVESVRM